jgi:hypothetical protein
MLNWAKAVEPPSEMLVVPMFRPNGSMPKVSIIAKTKTPTPSQILLRVMKNLPSR